MQSHDRSRFRSPQPTPRHPLPPEVDPGEATPVLPGLTPEMPFADILAYAGKCDLVLVEGYKREAFPKIEIRRDGAASREKLQGNFPQIVAIASDRPKSEHGSLPVFDLNDVKGIADFVIATVGLKTT